MLRKLIRRIIAPSLQRLDSRDAYAKWAMHYPPTPHNQLMQIEQDAMLSLMPPLTGKRVLDLACGTGRYAMIAERQGAEHVLGIDDSLDMLMASPIHGRLGGSMTAIPLLSACVDVAICGLAVGHVVELDVVLTEIARVLVVGGEAVISDFHPFQYLSGARRTFETNGGLFEVEHYPHLYATWHKVCLQVGLNIEAIHEPTLDNQQHPVVIVYRLSKH